MGFFLGVSSWAGAGASGEKTSTVTGLISTFSSGKIAVSGLRLKVYKGDLWVEIMVPHKKNVYGGVVWQGA